jgi:hypothetical protein
MKKTLVVLCLTMLLAMSTESRASIVNGSFETGDLDGWTVSFELLCYSEDGTRVNVDALSIFDEFPLMEPIVKDVNYYEAANGGNYLEIPGNPPRIPNYFDGYYTDGVGTISVSQQISLSEGDVLSGWAALYTFDYPPYNSDKAFVRVGNASISDQPVEITVKDAYGENWYNGGSDPQSTPWIYWTWTAPATDIYTLSLNNYMDDQEESIASFDGINVSHAVPEPSTMLMLVPAMVGIYWLRGIKFR